MHEKEIERFQICLHAIRIVAGLSNEKLADLLGVSRATVVNFDKKGISKPLYFALRYVFQYEVKDELTNTMIKILVENDTISNERRKEICNSIIEESAKVGRKAGIKKMQIIARKIAKDQIILYN